MMNPFKHIVQLLYPSLCVCCSRALVEGEVFVCSHCMADFPFADADFSAGGDMIYDFDISIRPDKIFALYYYDKNSKYRELVRRIKYHSKGDLGVYLGRMLGRRLKDSCTADVIVPVPLHPKRLKERGFNQSYMIAKGISEVTGIAIVDDVLYRNLYTKSQTKRTSDERRLSMEKVFGIKDLDELKNKHVLLVDDVITTGATIASCMKEIVKSGGVKFTLACLAQTQT